MLQSCAMCPKEGSSSKAADTWEWGCSVMKWKIYQKERKESGWGFFATLTLPTAHTTHLKNSEQSLLWLALGKAGAELPLKPHLHCAQIHLLCLCVPRNMLWQHSRVRGCTADFPRKTHLKIPVVSLVLIWDTQRHVIHAANHLGTE